MLIPEISFESSSIHLSYFESGGNQMSDREDDLKEVAEEISLREYLHIWTEKHPERTLIVLGLVTTFVINAFLSVSIEVIFNEPLYLLSLILAVGFLYFGMQLNSLLNKVEDSISQRQRLLEELDLSNPEEISIQRDSSSTQEIDESRNKQKETEKHE